MRKIKRIWPATKYEYTMALCNDGSLWRCKNHKWERLLEIPDDGETVCESEISTGETDDILTLTFRSVNYKARGMFCPKIDDLYVRLDGGGIERCEINFHQPRLIVEKI